MTGEDHSTPEVNHGIQYIKPEIFVEELLDPVPPDIRFWTFNGKVGAIHIISALRVHGARMIVADIIYDIKRK